MQLRSYGNESEWLKIALGRMECSLFTIQKAVNFLKLIGTLTDFQTPTIF